MTVSELIKMLERCPPDFPVKLAYDSMVCIYDVEEKESFIVYGDGGEHCSTGVYLTCGCGCYRDEEGGVPIPQANLEKPE